MANAREMLERAKAQRERDAKEAPKRGGSDFFKPEEGRKYLIAVPPGSPFSDLHERTEGVPWLRVMRWNQKFGSPQSDRFPSLPSIATTEDNWCLDHPTVQEAIKDDVDFSFDALDCLTRRVDDEFAEYAEQIGSKLVDTLECKESYILGIYLIDECDLDEEFADDIGNAFSWKKVIWWATPHLADQLLKVPDALPLDKKTKEPRWPYNVDGMTFIVLEVAEKNRKREYRIVADRGTISAGDVYKWSDAETEMLDKDTGEGGALNIYALVGRMVKDQKEIQAGFKGKTTKSSRNSPPPSTRGTAGRGRRAEPEADEEKPARGRRSEPEPSRGRRSEPEPEPTRSRRAADTEVEEKPSRSRRAEPEESAETDAEDTPATPVEPARRSRRVEPADEEKPADEPVRRSRRAASEPAPEADEEKDSKSTHEMDDDDDDDISRAVSRLQKTRQG